MTKYRIPPDAQRDLSSVWDFTEERWGFRQAETYIIEIRATIERISTDASRGRACDEIREGYRRYGIGSYLLFYVESADGVDVIRILQQRMDPTLHP